MAISIKELRVNNIVLAHDAISMRRCIIKGIHDDIIEVECLDIQTAKMVRDEVPVSKLEPVLLMESTLYALGFRKIDSIYGSPINTCYVLRRGKHNDVFVVKTNQWHLFIPSDNGSIIDKQELYLHTLQNILSHNKEVADEVNYDKFVELTSPYCVLPFDPKEE